MTLQCHKLVFLFQLQTLKLIAIPSLSLQTSVHQHSVNHNPFFSKGFVLVLGLYFIPGFDFQKASFKLMKPSSRIFFATLNKPIQSLHGCLCSLQLIFSFVRMCISSVNPSNLDTSVKLSSLM